VERDDQVRTLAYVSIPRVFFDPIVDPDLLNLWEVPKNDDRASSEAKIEDMMNDEIHEFFFGEDD
jgi:hypothetical protein